MSNTRNEPQNAVTANIRGVHSPVPTLRKNSEYRRVYRRGVSAAAAGLVVYAMKRSAARHAELRLGVSISAKVGNAVIRNRIRRRIKEICRLDKAMLLPGYDIVVVARTNAAGFDYREIERDLYYLLNKLGARKRL